MIGVVRNSCAGSPDGTLYPEHGSSPKYMGFQALLRKDEINASETMVSGSLPLEIQLPVSMAGKLGIGLSARARVYKILA